MTVVDPLRILWQSNAPWVASGYGQQSRQILCGLRERGHDVAAFSIYGLVGNALEYEGVPVLPEGNRDGWGEDVVRHHLHERDAELLVTLLDPFVLGKKTYGKLPVPWVAWAPVDSHGVGWPMLERLELADVVVAMSSHGAQQLQDAGIEPAATIYHGVDTEVMRRLDVTECRRALGIDEDCYLIGMVAANQGNRKLYPNQLRAVKRWTEENPGRNVKVYVHTNPSTSFAGWDLKRLVALVGLEGKVYATDEYRSTILPQEPEMMAQVYSAMDVLLNVSAGEGFGIPIVEAQACGVPVITHGVTSMPELTVNGYTVKPAASTLMDHYGWQFIPDEDDLVDRLESVYRMTDAASRQAGRDFVVKNCSLPLVVDAWEQLLLAVRQRVADARASRPSAPRAPLTSDVKVAREALEAAAEEYGPYEARIPEYRWVHEEMLRRGLRASQFVLDLGAGYGDLGRYLFEQGWRGTYVPVDMLIDGTDLNLYDPPNGFDFVVLSEIIEHLDDWGKLLDRVEEVAGCVIITTPNGAVVGRGEKHDAPGQMAHKHWVHPSELTDRGYDVVLANLTGRSNDAILAARTRT